MKTMMTKTALSVLCIVAATATSTQAATKASNTTTTTPAATTTASTTTSASVTSTSPEPQKVGYSFGYIMGKSNTESVKGLDVDAFLQGFKDGYAGKPALLSEEQIKSTLLQYKQVQDAQEMKAFEQKAKTNTDAGAKFLSDNAKKQGVVTTPSGLQYLVIKQGTGKKPSATSKVTVHYEGRLIDGTVFDSSIDRGEPINFQLNQVIAGWTEGLQLMQEGAKYRLFIPAKLGYGETGAGKTIGPNSTLIFDVELIKVN